MNVFEVLKAYETLKSLSLMLPIIDGGFNQAIDEKKNLNEQKNGNAVSNKENFLKDAISSNREDHISDTKEEIRPNPKQTPSLHEESDISNLKLSEVMALKDYVNQIYGMGSFEQAVEEDIAEVLELFLDIRRKKLV